MTISYVETLPYEDGVYEFMFPRVVGPRYIPGKTKPGDEPDEGKQAAAETDQVPDAARITPSHMPTGMRPGHDVSLEVTIDTGVPLEQIISELHEIEVDRDGNHQAVVRLKEKDEIPDRDFTLRFGVGGMQIADAVLAHRGERGGYFTHNGTTIITARGINNMVIVTSNSATISTSSSEISATIEHRRLDELPLNMRQPTELAKLSPGAAPT